MTIFVNFTRERIIKMESKLNKEALSGFGKAFRDKVMEGFFGSSDTISGTEILNLTPVKQINLFILKALFQAWGNETSKLKSPYFNYDGEPVRVALNEFMNVLSRNISISKEDFLPLFDKAVNDSINLIFSPYSYFTLEFDKAKKDKIEVSSMEEDEKYYKVNKHLYKALLERLKKMESETLTFKEIGGALEGLFSNIKDNPDDIQQHIESFSQIVPLDVSMIYLEENNTETEVKTPGNPSDKQQVIVNDKFEDTKTILNDKHVEGTPSLAEVMQRGKIENLGKSLSVNQRFMFVKELFKGNVEEFKKAIDYIDECAKKEDALKFLEDHYGKSKNWDIEKEEVIEFYDLVSRKFASESAQQ